MTALTDKRLVQAGLLADTEVPGFRAAMSHRAGRSPELLPARESIEDDPIRLEAFRRGARVAGIWRAVRVRHREVRDPDASEFGRRRENWRIEKTAFDQVVEAIAQEAGFPDSQALLTKEIADRIRYGDVEHLRSRVVEFYHADGPNGILSPTHPTLIEHAGVTWTSVEAIYQSQKHADAEIRRTIRDAPDALGAKAASKAFPTTVLTMKDVFKHGKREAMVRAQLLRARHDMEFRRALIETGDRPIVEIAPDGEPRDTRWGAFGVLIVRGWNTQGRILDAVRKAVIDGLVPTIEGKERDV